MKIRVLTWNMAYWSHRNLNEEVWMYILDGIDPDFVLFQEGKRPSFLENDKNFLWHNAGETKGRKDWGTGIYSKRYELVQEPLESIPCWNTDRFNELCVVAKSQVTEDKELTLISLYGRIDSITNIGYSIPNLHRILSDLTGLFNGHFGKRNIIIGGDLNASEQLDPMQGNNSHKLFFQRLKDFKLRDCFELKGHKDFVQTLRHHRSKLNWQNDYLFVSKKLAKGFIDCEVLDNEEIRKFSDHNPVLVTLEI